ncbi:MAG: sirohydrochlorin chelatase, partial [Arcobacter sp.]
LAAGKHVLEDIPCEIKKFKKQYPELEFILLPHIGLCNGIEKMIISNS